MAKLNVGVLNINRSLDQIDKYWQIGLFCDNCHSRQGQFCALVTNNASNVGIDKHSVSLQVCFEWPRDLLMYFQEHGRGSRWEGAKSTCIQYGNLYSYVYLMGQLLTGCNHDDSEEASANNEVNGFISAISPQKTNTRLGSKKTYPLRPTSMRNLRTRTVNELQEVLRFFCLDLGCQHARGEAYLSTGLLDHNLLQNENRCHAPYALRNGMSNFFLCIALLLLRVPRIPHANRSIATRRRLQVFHLICPCRK